MTSSVVEVVRGLYAGGPVNLAEIFANESAIKAWRSRIESVIHPEFEGGNPALEAKVMAPLKIVHRHGDPRALLVLSIGPLRPASG